MTNFTIQVILYFSLNYIISSFLFIDFMIIKLTFFYSISLINHRHRNYLVTLLYLILARLILIDTSSFISMNLKMISYCFIDRFVINVLFLFTSLIC